MGKNNSLTYCLLMVSVFFTVGYTLPTTAWANLFTPKGDRFFPKRTVDKAAATQKDIVHTSKLLSRQKPRRFLPSRLLMANDKVTPPTPFLPKREPHEHLLPLPAKRVTGYSYEGENRKKHIATLAVRFGRLLKQDNPSQQALSLVRNTAVDLAGSEIKHWLKQFGTVQTEWRVSPRFSLKGSHMDMLLAVAENKHGLFFTQWGLRNVDGRSIINLGGGKRYFLVNSMLGANVFIDHDISRRHMRVGAGGELWQDYSKLSANGYWRISSWKIGRDYLDYDERPAHGGDLHWAFYLPALPQVGGKLTYQQYIGDAVSLRSKQKKTKKSFCFGSGGKLHPSSSTHPAGRAQKGRARAS